MKVAVNFVLLVLPLVTNLASTEETGNNSHEPSPGCSRPQCTCQVTCGDSNPKFEQLIKENQQKLGVLDIAVQEVNERQINISAVQKKDMLSHQMDLSSLTQKVSNVKSKVDGFGDVKASLISLHSKVDYLQSTIDKMKQQSPTKSTTVPKDCMDVSQRGFTKSGVYTIDPDNTGAFKVWCDMDTPGGGWTVFQRRKDGSESFFRTWEDYKTGFGQLTGEYWLGNDKIHRLTKAKPNKLHIDLDDFGFNTVYADYSNFSIADETQHYKATVKGYSGTSGDSFTVDGLYFTTKDKDHDTATSNCAISYSGAWWYSGCHSSNLNGLYLKGKHVSYANGIEWYTWTGYYYSLKLTEMKISPK